MDCSLAREEAVGAVRVENRTGVVVERFTASGAVFWLSDVLRLIEAEVLLDTVRDPTTEARLVVPGGLANEALEPAVLECCATSLARVVLEDRTLPWMSVIVDPWMGRRDPDATISVCRMRGDGTGSLLPDWGDKTEARDDFRVVPPPMTDSLREETLFDSVLGGLNVVVVRRLPNTIGLLAFFEED